MPGIKGVLLDLSGVVFDGDTAIGDAIPAIADLRAAGIPIRFVTNTTTKPLRSLLETLRRHGVDAARDDIFTPASALRRILRERALFPHLLVHPDLLEDFDTDTTSPLNAVVVGDAGRAMTYDSLNAAFRIIDGGAAFIALARNRTFKDVDGQSSLDAGPFVAALEYATRREAEIVGKPSAPFYAAALADLGVSASEAVMIGDDVESDVEGAMQAGIAGFLVRTGKYRDGDESRIDPPPTALVADLREAVDRILDKT